MTNRFILIFVSILVFVSCDKKQVDNNINVEITDTDSTKEKSEEIPNKINPEIEEKILREIRKLSEVKTASKYIDSISDHSKGIAFMLQKPKEGSRDFYIRTGFNGEDRFETYYHFYVDTNDYKVKIRDVFEADIVDMEEWRKREESRK